MTKLCHDRQVEASNMKIQKVSVIFKNDVKLISVVQRQEVLILLMLEVGQGYDASEREGLLLGHAPWICRVSKLCRSVSDIPIEGAQLRSRMAKVVSSQPSYSTLYQCLAAWSSSKINCGVKPVRLHSYSVER